jgi:hypothetical protein
MYEPDGPPLTSSTAPGDEAGDETGDEDKTGDEDDPEQPASTPQAARPPHMRAVSCRGK